MKIEGQNLFEICRNRSVLLVQFQFCFSSELSSEPSSVFGLNLENYCKWSISLTLGLLVELMIDWPVEAGVRLINNVTIVANLSNKIAQMKQMKQKRL